MKMQEEWAARHSPLHLRQNGCGFGQAGRDTEVAALSQNGCGYMYIYIYVCIYIYIIVLLHAYIHAYNRRPLVGHQAAEEGSQVTGHCPSLLFQVTGPVSF